MGRLRAASRRMGRFRFAGAARSRSSAHDCDAAGCEVRSRTDGMPTGEVRPSVGTSRLYRLGTAARWFLVRAPRRR
jgi:hypothetical protein